ncbi:angiopoietin-related protein 7 isoform X2 [Eurosta solidaginis]|uniref:angiopoietin-related protein 7 isoform X2 n=1 Tax=Eurosta solidaginis TaxID=178769 RepID=UPI0035308EA3
MHFTSICFAAYLFVQLSVHVWCQQMLPQSSQTHRTNVTSRNWQHRTARPVSNSAETSKGHADLLTTLNDHVSVMASFNGDLRSRLENIEKKIVGLESNILARLDSIAVQQRDINKRLDSLDFMERQTKHNTDELIHERKKEEIAVRTSRQIDRLPQMPTNDEKLNSLASLLASTRLALNELDNNFKSSFSNLTHMVTRRLNNIKRQNHRQTPNFYATAHPSEPLITSCAQGHPTTNGILRIQLTAESEPFYVRCDEDENIFGGGWTVIQNRFNGKLNFFRDWLEYKAGFGNLGGEFFIGLEKLHALTTSAVHDLLILMQDFEGQRKYARYNLFAIGSEKEDYALSLLGEYEGDAGDSLTYHAGSKFSTFDNDNDGCVNCNCAQLRNGAWWYNWCDMSNLNGKYFNENENYNNTPIYEGMYWNGFGGATYSLKAVKMMIRPVDSDGDLQRR